MVYNAQERLIKLQNDIILGTKVVKVVGESSKVLSMKARKLTKETILDIDKKDRGFPIFRVGDTVELSLLVKEAGKERIQAFAGDVIAFHKNGLASTLTVRRIGANNIGVEKIVPYYSPTLAGIKVIKKGDVCRSKLYYVRERIGKAARIKEKVLTKEQKEQLKMKTTGQEKEEITT